MVARVVHGPAGPHGGAGAPAEFALRTGALGRHAWLPTHRRPVASAHSACLSRPPERMWTDAACPRPPPQGGPESMTPHETGSTTTPGNARATAPPTRTFGLQGPNPGGPHRRLPPGLPRPAVPVRQHRPRPGCSSHRVLRPRRTSRRADHLPDPPVPTRPARRRGGHRHHQPGDLGPPPHGYPRCPLGLARYRARLPRPAARKSAPRQGFFEHPEYLAGRAHLPAPWRDILDVAYYSGWRKQEILGLTWEEIDEAGGVIRLSPARSKTLVGRMLPISQPIAEALARRRARRDPDSPLVFHRDGFPVRRRWCMTRS